MVVAWWFWYIECKDEAVVIKSCMMMEFDRSRLKWLTSKEYCRLRNTWWNQMYLIAVTVYEAPPTCWLKRCNGLDATAPGGWSDRRRKHVEPSWLRNIETISRVSTDVVEQYYWFFMQSVFSIKPTLLSNRHAARWRRLDLFQQVGGASYIVTAVKYIWWNGDREDIKFWFDW